MSESQSTEDPVDPNSDEELAETNTHLLRVYLRYWKWPKSEQHHFDRTGERVDRHRQIERITAVIQSRNDRGPGRPLGYHLSPETKTAIAYAQTERKEAEMQTGGRWPSPPPCDDPRVTFDARLQASIRDNYQCRGCMEHYRIRYWKKPGDSKKYWAQVKDSVETVEVQHTQDIKMYLVPRGDPRDPDHLLTLCGYCRDTAVTGGLGMLGIRIVVEKRDDEEED